MQNDRSAMINTAELSLKKGNLPKADIICRMLLEGGERHPIVYEVMGHVSMFVRRYDMAMYYFQSALDVDPSRGAVKKLLTDIKKAHVCRQYARTNRESYLLVKAWGCGFWSDVDHVLGQLLLSEITGRIPVVYWSAASLFSDGVGSNAFELYFEPLSTVTIDDLIRPEYSYFPPKWSAVNLHKDNINKLSGRYSRMAGLYYLNRPEDVVVSDFHTYLYDLIHWIPSTHHLYGQDFESIYRYLFSKYLRVNPDIQQDIEKFRIANLAGRECLAVHVRGGDKLSESRNLSEINASYHEYIDQYLQKDPKLTIFLLTDSMDCLEEFNVRYAGNIKSTQCTRGRGNKGVHYEYQDSKVRNGIEVLRDAVLAAGCKYFIGNGRSNVSTAILHMKDWEEGSYYLLDGNMLYKPGIFLHDW